MSAPGQEPWDALTAALLQITQHAERLAALDEREATHYQQIAGRLTELARQLAETTDTVDRHPGHRRPAGSRSSTHSTASTSRSPLLAARLTDLAPARGDGDDGDR